METANQDYGYAVYGPDIRLRHAVMKIPSRLARNPDIRKIFIDIGFSELQKLNARRAEAISAGILVQQPDDFVPASIRVGDDTVRVKLRLKGDWVDHLTTDKWSFRIHTKGKAQLYGMPRFSIQHPATRGYQGEIIYHETLRQFGVLTPRYFFVDVVINGNDIGIMALEEHLSKELMERNGRKEGVIVRFDESLNWEEVLGRGGPENTDTIVFDNYLNAPLDAFQSSKVSKSENLSREFAIATGLLRGFIDGSLMASDVFDVEQLGSYLGVSEFWGAYHEVRWHNLRFYLNPLTMRLEPIAFDASLQQRNMNATITSEPIVDRMLDDPRVNAVFKSTLENLVKEVESGQLIEHLRQTEKKHLDVLQKEFVLLEPFDYEELYQRAKNITYMSSVDPKPEIYPVYVNAYLVQNEKKQYLELSNALPYPVEVQSIKWVDKSGSPTHFETEPPFDYPISLDATDLHTLPVAVLLDYRPLASRSKHHLEVKANIQGYNFSRTTTAQNSFPALDKNPMPSSSIRELLDRHPYMFLSDESITINVRPGEWQVDGNIVIPDGYGLIIPAGTTLQFERGASLVIYGVARFQGTAAAPIVLEGKSTKIDGKGEWQGLAIYNAPERSLWSYVTVRNTTGISWPLWKLTGGVTFYKSDVTINDSNFEDSRGEDALNIVHSNFTLENVSIINTASDAFDADFSTGSVLGGLYQDIGLAGGGDAIDVSGSKIMVENTRFVNINDKAVSVGERSEFIASGLDINGTGTGAASKDASNLELKSSKILNARVAGLMAYIKKTEYGPGRITASSINFGGGFEKARVQKGSYISVDGSEVQTVDIDVNEMYKTVMKKGLN